MSNKEKIIEFMKGKDKVSYKDIATGINLGSKFVASIISIEIKKGQTFERLERGFYKLK